MFDGAMSMGEEEPGSILWLSADEFIRKQREQCERARYSQNRFFNDDDERPAVNY